ncbi:hypothetical protein JCM8097_002206 [Rhodosporidiobolus ruineniae]
MPPYLPLEIVDKIHSEVEDRRALARWCRVARRFLDNSRERLYRSVAFTFDCDGDDKYYWPPAALRLFSTFVENRELAELVEEVKFEIKLCDHNQWYDDPWRGISATIESIMFDVARICAHAHSFAVVEDYMDQCLNALRAALELRCPDDATDHLVKLDLPRPSEAACTLLRRNPMLEHLHFSSTADHYDPRLANFSGAGLDDLRLSSLALGQVDPTPFLNKIPRPSLVSRAPQYGHLDFSPDHFRTLLSSSLPPNLRLLTYDRRHIPLTVPHVDWEADNLRAHIRMWNELEDERRERGIWCKGLRAGPAEWDPHCERPLLLP